MSGWRSDSKGSIAALFPTWVRNLSFQWLSTTYVAVVSFFVSVMLARALGVSGFGTYSYLLALAGIYMILQNGGYKTLLFRNAVGRSESNILRFGVGHVTVVTVVGGGVILLIRPQEWETLLVVVVCMGLVVVSEFVSSVLKGSGKFGLDALWKVVIRTATAAAILCLIFFYKDQILANIFLAWGFALLVALIWPLAKGWLSWPSFRIRGDLIKSNIAFLTIDFSTILYFRSDIVLLKYLGHEVEGVGQYAAAHRVVEGVILLATPVAQLAFRALRVRWLEKSDFFRLFKVLLFAMLLIAGAISLVGAMWAEELMVLIFGEPYQSSGTILFWLLLSMVFVLPNYILTQGAIALDKEVNYAWIALGVAFVNIALNLYWIPKYGPVGAAWATIAAEGVLCLGLSYIFLKTWDRQRHAS